LGGLQRLPENSPIDGVVVNNQYFETIGFEPIAACAVPV
jgi:hypothetical protein